jgi:hypothetical protein
MPTHFLERQVPHAIFGRRGTHGAVTLRLLRVVDPLWSSGAGGSSGEDSLLRLASEGRSSIRGCKSILRMLATIAGL